MPNIVKTACIKAGNPRYQIRSQSPGGHSSNLLGQVRGSRIIPSAPRTPSQSFKISVPSYISNLREGLLISSMSWRYMAGNQCPWEPDIWGLLFFTFHTKRFFRIQWIRSSGSDRGCWTSNDESWRRQPRFVVKKHNSTVACKYLSIDVCEKFEVTSALSKFSSWMLF